jgi:capsular polysaccharide transport system permease protein
MPSVDHGSLKHSIVIQCRVVHALLIRELITRFGRENLGVLWLVGEPMLFTLGVVALWSLGGLHAGSNLPIVAFTVTGYSTILLWRNTTNRCATTIEENKQLLFHRNVRVIDAFVARTVLEIIGATCSFIVLSATFLYAGWMAPPVDLLKVLTGWLLLAWFSAGLGTTVGSAAAFSDVVHRIWHPMSYFMLPFSGALIMVEWTPPAVRNFILLFPMAQGTEMLREGWFGNAVVAHYDVTYTVACCLVLSLVALGLQFEATRRLEM